MRKDHRPYHLKRAYRKFEKWYADRFLRPQLDHLGKSGVFIKPWHVEIFGPGIRIGNHPHVIAASDLKVRLSVWSRIGEEGRIQIGDCCLICPGVRVSAARGISIGDDCMLACGAYITDSDWHGIYDRISQGVSAPVVIEDNVWIGDRATVCKGVTIGRNSIVGAGAVVTRDVPTDVIAAGNPAVIVKRLDPEAPKATRSQWLSSPRRLPREFDQWDRELLGKNTLSHWLRHVVFPRKGE